MSSDSDVDTSRVVVQTYVPSYQREEWDQHADELDMSRSEFVRTMVQAGRRGFGADPEESVQPAPDQTSNETETNTLEQQVVDLIDRNGPLDWEELLAELTGDIETRLETAIESLQEEDTVRYSGPVGAYVLEGEE